MSDDLLSDKFRRRQFYLFGIVLLAALLLVRALVLPLLFKQPFSGFEVLGGFIDAVAIAVLASLSVVAFVEWTTSPRASTLPIQVVEPRYLRERLEEIRTGTNEFWYRGHTAKWTRAVTLPDVARQAGEAGLTKRVRLVISDPSNQVTCQTYADLRRPSSDPSSKFRDYKRAQHELYATIVSAYAWKEEQPLLDLSINLTDKVSFTRLDVFTAAAVVTTPDRTHPSLLCPAGSHFYEVFREEFHLVERQSRRLDNKVRGEVHRDLSARTVRRLLAALGFDVSELIEEELATIVDIARTPQRPY